MFGLLKKWRDIGRPDWRPDPFAMPDMTGMGLPMDYWINAIGGQNKQKPSAGDVVAKLVSCGMGMTVQRDIRYVVKSDTPRYDTSFVVEDVKAGTKTELHVHNLRRHRSLPRTWVEIA